MSRYRADVKIIARTGCPGTGKTTRIARECWDWPSPWQIVTYSIDAADALHQKNIPSELAGTIYKKVWKHVTACCPEIRHSGKRSAPAFRSRAITDSRDIALKDYEDGAASRRKQDDLLNALHGWSPDQGDPPSWIWDKPTPNQSYAVGIARWLHKGAPLSHTPYKFIAYDEAQDASRLELCAALALVEPGGTLMACGDEGQAIFGGFKGYQQGELPAAWQWADEREFLSPGYRVGRPATEIASAVLAPYAWHDPALYSADHPTMVHHWDMLNAPTEGLVMGLSRTSAKNYAEKNDLTYFKVVPGAGIESNLIVTHIHAAKGHEADSIYLLPWSRNRLNALDGGDPEMLKVAYVALTRARYHVWLPTELYARWT